MSSTLRELLDIPREAAKTSFVVKLTDAVEHADVLMGQYAVTPSIVNALDHALDLVRVAVRDRISRATYVHGSFGSGKSHFMAAVSLLLATTRRRGRCPRLETIIGKRGLCRARHNIRNVTPPRRAS